MCCRNAKSCFSFLFLLDNLKESQNFIFTSLSGENLDREKVAKVRIRRGTSTGCGGGGLRTWKFVSWPRVLGSIPATSDFFSGEPTVLIFVRYFVYTQLEQENSSRLGLCASDGRDC